MRRHIREVKGRLLGGKCAPAPVPVPVVLPIPCRVNTYADFAALRLLNELWSVAKVK
jgi:hypothetical protein